MQQCRRRHPTPDLQRRARDKLAEIEDRMADLARIRDGLQQVLAARCDSLTNCTCQDCPPPFIELAAVRPTPTAAPTASAPAPARPETAGEPA